MQNEPTLICKDKGNVSPAEMQSESIFRMVPVTLMHVVEELQRKKHYWKE